MNIMGWQRADVAGNPTVRHRGLEKWIVTRYSVIRVLRYRGFIVRGDYSLGTVLVAYGHKFLDRFVIKYHDQVPELPSIFEGKSTLAELGLGFDQN